MGYVSPDFLEHIHGPGIREGVCLLLVALYERVPCPTWSGSANMTTAEKSENLRHTVSFKRATITTESATIKILVPNAHKMENEKTKFFAPGKFQQRFQPFWPRREQEGNGWHRWTRHCYGMPVGIHRFVRLHKMSERRAREIFENCYCF